MNALEAAVQVLAQSGEELSKHEIAKRAIASGIWLSTGKTPYETIGSQIYTDIKKHGEQSRFILVKPGVFKLKETGAVQLSLAPVTPAPAPATPTPKKATAPRKVSAAATHTPAPQAAPAPQAEPAPKKQPSTKLVMPRQPEETPDNPLPELTYVAQRILQDQANGKPMHYRNIVAKAINAGWAMPLNGSPAEALYAQVITEIKKRSRTGEPQRFVRYKNGFLGLVAWNDHDLSGIVCRQNQKLVDEIAHRLQRLSADQCQALLTRILAELGYENVIFTPPETHAKPFTVSAVYTAAGLFKIPVAILVAPMETPITLTMVHGLKDALSSLERGIIITTDSPSKEVVEAAREGEITLVSTHCLANVMLEHSICIRKNPVICCEIDQDELPER